MQHIVLQPPTLVSIVGSNMYYQAPEFAPEVGRFGRLLAQVQVPVAGPSGASLQLQTSADRFPDSFYPPNGAPTVPLDQVGNWVLDFQGEHARYVRWKVLGAGTSGDARFQVDLIGRRESAVRYFKLQEPAEITAATLSQRLSEAVEVGPFAKVIVVTRVTTAAAGGTLWLQHGARRETDSFKDLGTSVSLSTVNVLGTSYTNLLRYLRWNSSAAAAGAKFSIDLICRER